MESLNLTFIGAGNMARSLIGGLLAAGFPRERISATDPNEVAREQLTQQLGVRALADNAEAARQADVVVLAVKPQQLQAVCRELSPAVGHRPLIISIAAGIRTDAIDRWLGGGLPIVRTMPNTPALVRSGATGLYANAQVMPEQKDAAENILRTVGLTLWVEKESLLDAVTAISGSGPAYFFLFMEALADAGESLGLTPEAARLLTVQTALGAARMALEGEDDLAELRRRVTSPGGTTAAALAVFDEAGCREIIHQAAEAARNRAEELAEQLGRDEEVKS
ncbi:pyrroline-5-carboxylate reductase [Sulfurivirga sp.]|uniref:pyrroline-5-carboxylate reductase n=1 Tax=Sulfurivirga sp. TaxID=2614236 RepID=UPI0025EA6086|nr:pyrroline-5-carboxylate reductase [Sulfurivirga sp.]